MRKLFPKFNKKYFLIAFIEGSIIGVVIYVLSI